MPSLLEALSGGFDTVGAKNVENGEFAKKLDSYKNSIVSEYMKFNIDLNKLIAKVAQKENLNDDQIQRIVEEVNNQVYLIKYNQMKHRTDREVVFDLASLAKIKEEISGVSTTVVLPGGTERVAAIGTNKMMEKVASWEEDSQGDSINMFNSGVDFSSSLSPEAEKSMAEIKAEKVAKEIIDINEELNEAVMKTASLAYNVADCLVQYSKHGIDPGFVFEDICKIADCSTKSQALIKSAVERKVETMKEARLLPEDYSVNLEYVNTKEKNQYSLGEYSFSKEAEFSGQSNQPLPIVVTDKKAIKNINQLVKAINDLEKSREDIGVVSARKDKIIKGAGITSELAEKMASAWLAGGWKGAFKNFGTALKGTEARNLKKSLTANENKIKPLVKAHSYIKNPEARKEIQSQLQKTLETERKPLLDAYAKATKSRNRARAVAGGTAGIGLGVGSIKKKSDNANNVMYY
jgi:hypothetical protein